METRPPTFGRIAIAAGFALSCFGLLLFLWLAFGGPIPLKSKSYRVDVHFDEASQVAVESDVRISGVSVGKVKAIELGDDGLADATLEIDPKYAPIPSDTKAMLRQKTLLGETYVELTPGNQDAPPLPEGGTLDDGSGLRRRPARRDLPGVRRADAGGLPDLDGRCRRLLPRPWRRPQRRARQPRPVRRAGRRPAADPRLAAARGQEAPRRRRRHLRRDQQAARPAPLADPEHRVGVLDDGRPRHRDPPDLPGAADLPRRVEADARAPRQVLGRHEPTRHPASAGRPAAQRHVPGAEAALARAEAVLHRAAARSSSGPSRASARCGRSSTTSCRRSSAASTRSSTS